MNATPDDLVHGFILTTHARERLDHRNLPDDALRVARRYGRRVRANGAVHLIIGDREIARAAKDGAEDIARYRWLDVVLAPDGSNIVLTLYQRPGLAGLLRDANQSRTRAARQRRRDRNAREDIW